MGIAFTSCSTRPSKLRILRYPDILSMIVNDKIHWPLSAIFCFSSHHESLVHPSFGGLPSPLAPDDARLPNTSRVSPASSPPAHEIRPRTPEAAGRGHTRRSRPPWLTVDPPWPPWPRGIFGAPGCRPHGPRGWVSPWLGAIGSVPPQPGNSWQRLQRVPHSVRAGTGWRSWVSAHRVLNIYSVSNSSSDI